MTLLIRSPGKVFILALIAGIMFGVVPFVIDWALGQVVAMTAGPSSQDADGENKLMNVYMTIQVSGSLPLIGEAKNAHLCR
jgi:hypothetical protein